MRLWLPLSFLLSFTLLAPTDAAAAPKTVGIYVGNNSYPGLPTNLSGAVIDAQRYADAFRRVLGDVEEHKLLNTSLNTFTSTLQQAVARCQSGEIGRLIITISSHGTVWAAADNRAAIQAIVFSDADSTMTTGVLKDTAFRALLDQIPKTVGVELLLDTCFSAGMTRELPAVGATPSIRRYVPHPGFRPEFHRLKTRAVRSTGIGVPHIAEWAACGEKESANDTAFGGAFSSVWVRHFLDKPRQSRRDLLQSVQKAFGPADQQTPQFLAP